MNELAPITPHSIQTRLSQPRVQKLLDSFLSSQKESTRIAYTGDLKHFAKFRGFDTPSAVSLDFLSQGHGEANSILIDYKDYLRKNYAPLTTNRRLAAIKSLVKMAKMLDIINWDIEVQGVKAEQYKDTSGPGLESVRRMLDVAAKQPPAKAARDVAILWIAITECLRRAEIYGLDFEHLTFDEGDDCGVVSILGKGRDERQSMTVPPRAMAALKAWIEIRGDMPGPLFCATMSTDGRWADKRMRERNDIPLELVDKMNSKNGTLTTKETMIVLDMAQNSLSMAVSRGKLHRAGPNKFTANDIREYRFRHQSHLGGVKPKQRLSGRGFYSIIAKLGERIGVKVHPHGLRHFGITQALVAKIPIRDVQKLSRHHDVNIIERYDDNLADVAGDVARKIEDAI